MAFGPVVRVDGAARLRRTMRAAGADMTDLKRINRDAADTAAAAARLRVPTRSGRLAASIRTAGTTRAGIIRAGRKAVPYAGPIHWGWPARGIKAQPFITEAAQDTESAWTAKYLDNVNELLDKIEGV